MIRCLASSERACLTRCRLLALRGQQAAGGTPRVGQLVRAWEPLLWPVVATTMSERGVGATVVTDGQVAGEEQGEGRQVARF